MRNHSRRPTRNPVGPSKVIATPVLYRNRVYVALGQDPMHGPGQGMLSCIDVATGKNIWCSKRVERNLSAVSIQDGVLYVPTQRSLIACPDPGALD